MHRKQQETNKPEVRTTRIPLAHVMPQLSTG
jgi:hypothetical protein